MDRRLEGRNRKYHAGWRHFVDFVQVGRERGTIFMVYIYIYMCVYVCVCVYLYASTTRAGATSSTLCR